MAAIALGVIVACARIGSPPGGPEDKVPPKLLATVPESTGTYPNWKSDVEFRFDEVISEGSQANIGSGTGDLEKLVLVSPSRGVPVVQWKRDRITVRPREGWKPNRVYRIELLPGLFDLRRNRLDTTKVITFTTGAPLPTDTLHGIVIDWPNGAVARQALIELIIQPDSLIYRTITDSSGRFRIGPLPHANYLAYGAIDQNKNNQREQREAYDSTLVAGSTTVPTLWIIPRDTIGPRIQTAVPADSTGALLTMTQPVDPFQSLDSVGVRLLLQSDSSAVPVLALRTQQLDDTLQRKARERADSIRIANDTTIKKDTTAKAKPVAPPVPKPVPPGAKQPKVDVAADSILKSRPPLTTRLVLRTQQPLKPDTKYIVELRGLRSVAGRTNAESRQVLVMPKPAPPPDSTTADSLKGDSPRVTPADSAAPPVKLPADAPKPRIPRTTP